LADPPTERCGGFEYFTRHDPSGEPALLRRRVGPGDGRAAGAACGTAEGEEAVLAPAIVAADARRASARFGKRVAGSEARTVKVSRDHRLLAYTLPWDDSGDACCGIVRDIAKGGETGGRAAAGRRRGGDFCRIGANHAERPLRRRSTP
jgi:hypothetical protein